MLRWLQRRAREYFARRSGRKQSLEGIVSPTPVRLATKIASPNVVTSPVTGARAALVHWSVFMRFFGRGRQGDSRPEEVFQWVSEGCFCGDLQLESGGRLIDLPASQSLVVRFPGANDYGSPVEQQLPRELSHVYAKLPQPRKGPLYYREMVLCQGHAITLIATVAPTGKTSLGTYRSGDAAPFRVRADLEPAVLEDETALSVPF